MLPIPPLERYISVAAFYLLIPDRVLYRYIQMHSTTMCLIVNPAAIQSIFTHRISLPYSVNTTAEHVVFQCLVEDTPLFLRFVMERLTRTQQKDELIFVLRKMIRRLPELPMQTAHGLFNNLVRPDSCAKSFYCDHPSNGIAGFIDYLGLRKPIDCGM